MMKKIIAAILLGIMLCSLAAVSFADTNYFNFNISSASERPNGTANRFAMLLRRMAM